MPILLSLADAPTLSALVNHVTAQAPGLVSNVIDGAIYNVNHNIQGIAPLTSASPEEITFIVSPKYHDQLLATAASAVAMDQAQYDVLIAQGKTPAYAAVICTQPYLFYALMASWFDRAMRSRDLAGVHPSACIDPSAIVDATASIGPNVVIGAHTVVGARVNIEANCVVGQACEIGAGGHLYPGVFLYDRVKIGTRVILHSGVVLGADGFGFAPNPLAGKGAWGKIAQLGGVQIGNDVEIGANTTIDRGALEDTVIGNGVKLDNLIMIAHNCQIGDHTAIAACVGIAGSTKIGARCIIGGASMFSGHLRVIDDVQISGGTAVTSDIKTPGRYTGVYPFASHGDWQKNAAVLGQLSTLRKRLRDLERQ